ncbi:MAG: hypothetical protein Q4C91_08510 [Eubacteriales bacterium]|nr:hypothetical protein [Eubacteriales bacterium]
MKEIGGYLQMEQLSGKEYYPELLPLNLGRTALLYALEKLQVRRLYIPNFICDSITAMLFKWAGTVTVYPVGNDFLPAEGFLQSEEAYMKDGSYLFVINYYGQITNKMLRSLKEQCGNLIVDNTHSFFQHPLPGVPTLYSCRKYFGLPDGAYLSLPEKPEDFSSLPMDCSNHRLKHILGRYEQSASLYYGQMLDTAHSFYEEPVKQMSLLTRNLLRGINYQKSAAQREENFRILDGLLGAYQPREFYMSEGPFVYPFYSPDAPLLKKRLAENKIFVPTYWNNVIEEAPRDSVAYDLAAHILPLPIDQRYSREDMERIAWVLTGLLKEVDKR